MPPPEENIKDVASSASSVSSQAAHTNTDPIKADKLAALGVTDVTLGVVPKKDMWEIFRKRPDESRLHYAKRLCSEGHSVPDAFLTCASSQIGQIMLTCPNALWKAGLVGGGLFAGLTMIWALFSTFVMNVLYMERKRTLIKDGRWAKASQHSTQFHDVLGFHAGTFVRYLAQTVIALQLIGTGAAQVIACAADWYSVDKRRSKRELQVIWGAVLQLFVFFPTFKHFRIMNIAALAGTTTTAIFLLHEARVQGYADISLARLWPVASANGVTSAPQYFFTGAAVLMNALGSHAIIMETMDVMETPKQFTAAYTGGWLWTIFLVVPHSIAINLAFPTKIGGSDNVYGIIPMSKGKLASVGLMVIHQLAAFAYYVTPVMYMWERLIRTHNKPWYIRLPSRLPVSLVIWFIAMAFPFYGAINSLMSSISAPLTAFALPFTVFIWLYRTPEARANAALPPLPFLQKWNWAPVFFLAGAGALLYIGFGFAAVAYSLKSIVDNSKTFGVFARCYQCPANYVSLLQNPGNNL